jgi:hypothetical protein
VPGDVVDRLPAVVERAADVEADPGLGVVFHLVSGLVTVARATSSTSEGVLDQRGRPRPARASSTEPSGTRAEGLLRPTEVRVADIMTTAFSESSFSRSGPRRV